MKVLFALLISLLMVPAFAQHMRSAQWDEEAKTNIRLLPKYGHVPKNEAQKTADREFIAASLKTDFTNVIASEHMIELGFKYLYNDIKTAMYRFNQAWLLDSNNIDVYWGFGAVYMQLGDYERAKSQYLEGLAINPKSTHLLTDYGSYFLAQYYGLEAMSKKEALQNLDSAISYLGKSFRIDPADQNTSFKLSVCYWNKKDCDNAWKYYDACKSLGGQPITEEYSADLQNTCARK